MFHRMWAANLYISSTSRTDFPNSLVPSVSITNRFRQVFQATSCVRTKLMSITSSWSSYPCSFMWRSTLKNVTYEIILAPPAVSYICCSSNLDGLREGGRCPCICCFVGCWFQDWFNITCSILEQLLSSFASVQVVDPYYCIDAPR